MNDMNEVNAMDVMDATNTMKVVDGTCDGVPQTTWRTPDYTVIETALEVTAYSLTAR